MSLRLDDVNARARGLGTHLLHAEALKALCRSPDLTTLAEALERAGLPRAAVEGGTSAAELELAVRRAAARRIEILVRWLGDRSAALGVVLEDEDRRSLRAMLHGAVAGAAPEHRLAGLIPTPLLPERALEELAHQPNTGAIAALLVAWSHPYGSPLLGPASAAEPDLFQLGTIVNRTYAARATATARAGGRALRAFTAETIDLENVMAALVLAAAPGDVDPRAAFLPGGWHVAEERFLRAVASANVELAAGELAGAFAGTRLRGAIVRHRRDPVALEEALLAARIRAQRDEARKSPLGPAPLLGYLLRLRAEATNLRAIIWGVALGVPAPALAETLVAG